MAGSGKSAKPTSKKPTSKKPTGKKPTDDRDDESSGSRVWAILAAAGVVALAIVLIVTTRTGTPAAPSASSASGTVSSGGSAASTAGSAASTAPSSATSASSSVDPADASVCGLSDVAMSGTVTEAPQATWSLIGTMAAPSIKGQGPGATDADGYPSCFARTPLGALVAASTYLAMGSYEPWRRKYYERAMVPGKGQQVLLSKPVMPPETPNGIQVQISGFYVVSYNGQLAEIDLGLLANDGSEGAKLMSLQWSGGDWKVRLNDDGDELSPLREKHPEDQFVPWSAGL